MTTFLAVHPLYLSIPRDPWGINGNLLSLQRNKEDGSLQDDLEYEYYTGTNRLRNVSTTDGDNYQYDAIGNLVRDLNEGTHIRWTPYGKVREVLKDSVVVHYRYDGSGNRVEKKVEKSGQLLTTRYIRDASGNVMGVYQDTLLTEQPIYGSSRLGQYKGGMREGHRTLGKKQYELTNHLGNVLAVITDNAGMNADSVWATVVSTSDYYPFGLEMKGRSYSGGVGYRYGFNGKEKDPEGLGGGGSTYDYGFRIYNPQIAKFLSVDPLTKSYPWYTPYQFAGNKPIRFIDLDGLEEGDYQLMFELGKALVKGSNEWVTEKHAKGQQYLALLKQAEPDATYIDKMLVYGAGYWLSLENNTPLGSVVDSTHEVITGEDRSNGQSGNRMMAGGALVFELFGGKMVGTAFKGLAAGKSFLLKKVASNTDEAVDYVKYESKFSNSVSDLIEGSAVRQSSLHRKIKEIVTVTKSGTMEDAVTIARSKVGNVTTPLRGELSHNKRKIVGYGTTENHWRLDWSKKGAIPIKMTKEVYERTLKTIF